MGAFSRFTSLFGSKDAGSRASRAKHDAGTPSSGELTLAEARLKQQAAVQQMRRGVADVSVSRQRLDLQVQDLQKAMDSLQAQATDAEAAGDAGAAQTALGRHVIMAEQLSDLVSQRDALAEQEAMLVGTLAQLQARVSGFNVTAESLGAAQVAAEARRSIARSLDDLQALDDPRSLDDPRDPGNRKP